MTSVVINKSRKLILSLGLVSIFALYSLAVTWRGGKIADTLVGFFKKEVVTTDNNASTIPTLPDFSTRASSSKYVDGSYMGSVEDVYYGNVSVKAVITNGYISDVVFVEYPKDRSNSVKISDRAMPILKSEAIQSQSANVDIVSGATQTSKGFIRSLTNALAQASK